MKKITYNLKYILIALVLVFGFSLTFHQAQAYNYVVSTAKIDYKVGTECSDGVDNTDPEDKVADTNDPGCHTDGNVANAGTYDAADNDETDGPPQPTNVVATRGVCGSGTIDLSWTFSAGATSYNILRKENAGSYLWIGSTGGATFADNNGLVSGSTYIYIIKAQDGAGNTTNSNPSNAVDAPAVSCTGLLPNLHVKVGSVRNWANTTIWNPVTANTGVPLNIVATVENIGTANTGAPFYSLFQVSTSNRASGIIASFKTRAQTPALVPFVNLPYNALSSSYTFPSSGTYYVRACADTDSAATVLLPNVPTNIIESSENDNCNGWGKWIVTNPPIIGSCSATHFNCSSPAKATKTVTNNTTKPYNYTWTCPGSNGGADNDSCNEPYPQCDDGIDNDDDKLIDFGPDPKVNDPGCIKIDDNTEKNIKTTVIEQ